MGRNGHGPIGYGPIWLWAEMTRNQPGTCHGNKSFRPQVVSPPRRFRHVIPHTHTPSPTSRFASIFTLGRFPYLNRFAPNTIFSQNFRIRRTWTDTEELLKEKSFFILSFVFLSEFVIRQVQTNIY